MSEERDHKNNVSLSYLAVDLFCTLDEIAEEGGTKGKMARLMRRWLTPAGALMFGEVFMLDLFMRGRAVMDDYEHE